MSIEYVKLINKSLLKWIMLQDINQHVKMRMELEDNRKKGFCQGAKYEVELDLLTRLTCGDSSRSYAIEKVNALI